MQNVIQFIQYIQTSPHQSCFFFLAWGLWEKGAGNCEARGQEMSPADGENQWRFQSPNMGIQAVRSNWSPELTELWLQDVTSQGSEVRVPFNVGSPFEKKTALHFLADIWQTFKNEAVALVSHMLYTPKLGTSQVVLMVKVTVTSILRPGFNDYNPSQIESPVLGRWAASFEV